MIVKKLILNRLINKDHHLFLQFDKGNDKLIRY